MEVELLTEQHLQSSRHVIYLLCEWVWINYETYWTLKAWGARGCFRWEWKRSMFSLLALMERPNRERFNFMQLMLGCMLKPQQDWRSHLKSFWGDQTHFWNLCEGDICAQLHVSLFVSYGNEFKMAVFQFPIELYFFIYCFCLGGDVFIFSILFSVRLR